MSKGHSGSEQEESKMDYQIYSEMVQQIHNEEAERERLIQAARKQRQKGDSLLRRIYASFIQAISRPKRAEGPAHPPVDVSKREPVV